MILRHRCTKVNIVFAGCTNFLMNFTVLRKINDYLSCPCIQKNPPFISKHHIIPFLFSIFSPSSTATVSLGYLEFSDLSHTPGGVRILGEGKKHWKLFIHHQNFVLNAYNIGHSKEDLPSLEDWCFILITIQGHNVSCSPLQLLIPHILHFCISSLS